MATPDEHYAFAERELTRRDTASATAHALLALAGYQREANAHAAEQAADVREFVRGAMGDYHPVITVVQP